MLSKKIKNRLNFGSRLKREGGFGLVEIIVGISVITVAFFAMMQVANVSLKVLKANENNLKATFLLEEGLEAVKIMRDSGWTINIDALSNNVDYYFEFSGGMWHSTTTNVLIDNFYERKFILGSVYRDSNDDIAPSGILEVNARKVSVSVSWSDGRGETTKTISTYITNLFE